MGNDCARGKIDHHWPTARRAALERAGHACERCGSELGLHVHHDRPAEGNRTWGCVHHAENLAVLCEPCHRMEHEWLRAVARGARWRQMRLPIAA